MCPDLYDKNIMIEAGSFLGYTLLVDNYADEDSDDSTSEETEEGEDLEVDEDKEGDMVDIWEVSNFSSSILD